MFEINNDVPAPVSVSKSFREKAKETIANMDINHSFKLTNPTSSELNCCRTEAKKISRKVICRKIKGTDDYNVFMVASTEDESDSEDQIGTSAASSDDE